MSEAPWLSADAKVRIARSVIEQVEAAGVREYPNEACGFLLGPLAEPGHVDEARVAVNLADKYHKADPETFPRTARTFYMIDARVIDRTFTEGGTNGRPVKVIFHSHCDVGAYFSAEDQAAATPDGALAYPVLFLVTSVRDGKVDDHKLFAFRDGAWHDTPFESA